MSVSISQLELRVCSIQIVDIGNFNKTVPLMSRQAENQALTLSP
jgi:hypothetical protein